MSKKKFEPTIIRTEEGLGAAIAEFVKLKLQHAAKKADMELAVAKAQEKFQDDLSELGQSIESQFYGIQGYCQQHRSTLFSETRKSIDLVTAVVGFRTNPPSVQIERKKTKWGDIAKALLGLEWGKLFVRYPDPEVDKEALLSARGRLTPEQLRDAGLSIQQEEEFYIAPKAEMAGPTATDYLC